MRMPLPAIALALFAVFAVANPALAQDEQKIAAIVNDEIITAYDVGQRSRLALSSSGIPVDDQALAQVEDQILRQLIDERLQLQEARKREIVVSEEEISAAMAEIIRNNDMTMDVFEQFLESNGIQRSTLERQIRTELAWNRTINKMMGFRIAVSEEMINRQLEQLRAYAGRSERLVSEIFLPIDRPENEEIARQFAVNLVEQVKTGASFSNLARQFSQGSTAASGGDLGWVREGQLAPELDLALAAIPVGGLSDPVRGPEGWYIFGVRDSRVIAGGDPNLATVTMRQIVVPVDVATASEDLARERIALAESIRNRITGCDSVDQVVASAPGVRVERLDEIQLGSVDPQFRARLRDLQAGQTSSAIPMDDGLSMFVMCQRVDPEGGLPSRDAVQSTIERQQLSLLAKRYMRDLRADGTVELR